MTGTPLAQVEFAGAERAGGRRRTLAALAAAMLASTAMASPAFAADAAAEAAAADDAAADAPEGEIVVTGALGALPLKDVGSIFGFDKTIVETPRSASTISAEQIERFGISDIYDLVAQAPGTFTNSFFGVGGALDIRGSPGEVYFRGVRRLDNAGNYPTPIGASERVDIVRGPASPIYGPSKTGGYMNFVPKSARVQGGAYLAEPEGEISYTGGSYGRNVLKANVRGPARIGAQEFGYSLYAEVEDSNSYYRNGFTKQTILQAAFDSQISDVFRVEFGGMYHNFDGSQNAGWNRLTQDLVDNGTYITGTAQPLDTNGDGQISQGEINAAGGLTVFGGFGCGNFAADPGAFTDACFTSTYPQLALQNVGTTKLSRRQGLTAKNDVLKNKATTLYFDAIFSLPDDLEIKNQLFYDSYENLNENQYGFSQIADSYVIENKLIISKKFENQAGKFSFQISPSVRYTNFEHGDDFLYEYFNRVDLSMDSPYDARSDRLLSTECMCGFTNYDVGSYTDYAIAGLIDLDFDFGLDVMLGGRYDWVKARSRSVAALTESGAAVSEKGSKGGFSYTASVSYELPFGVIPYATISKQSTIITGQGADILPVDIAAGTFLSASKLYEGGIKGTFLDGKLYAAVSVYKQKRTDFNAQAIVTNASVETKGAEAEFRWSVNENFLVTGAYTRTTVTNLTMVETGANFSHFGIEDLINVINPALFLGGAPIGNLIIANKGEARRAGIPKNLFSLTATYSFDNGIAFSGSVVNVDSVFSGQSQAVKLPAYTLVDLGASFETGPWLFRVVVKNVTDERYFRANFVELFGSTIALPEKPRNFQASVVYKF
jgi:iron complex outermembrane receptor protein